MQGKYLQKTYSKFKKPKLYRFWNFLIYGSSIAIGVFLVYLYSAYVFINKWPTCTKYRLLMELWVFYCLEGLHTLLLKWNANFYIFSNKDLLDKFFDFCRESQQEILPEELAEILREYADRLDEW